MKGKGRKASLTENRRLCWDMIIWPLILELDRPFFTLREYHEKRDYISRRYGILLSRFRSGFVSLLYRGFVTKCVVGYSLNWGLQKYIHRRAVVGYAIAAKSILRAY